MNALLIVQNNDNYLAVICENLQTNDLEKIYTQENKLESFSFFKSFVFQLGAKQNFITQKEEIDNFLANKKSNEFELDLILKYNEKNQSISFFIPNNIDNNDFLIEYSLENDFYFFQEKIQGIKNEQFAKSITESEDSRNKGHISEETQGNSNNGGTRREQRAGRNFGGLQPSFRDELGERSQRSVQDSQKEINEHDGKGFTYPMESSSDFTEKQTQTSNNTESQGLFDKEFNEEFNNQRGNERERSTGTSTTNNRQTDNGRNERELQESNGLFNNGDEGFKSDSLSAKEFQSTNERLIRRIDLLLQSTQLEGIVKRVSSDFARSFSQADREEIRENNERETLRDKSNNTELQREPSLFDISSQDGGIQSLSASGGQNMGFEMADDGGYRAGTANRGERVDTTFSQSLSTSQEDNRRIESVSNSNANNIQHIQGMSSNFSNSVGEQESLFENADNEQSNGDTHQQSQQILQGESNSSNSGGNTTDFRDNELGVSKGENGEQDNTNELPGETHLGKEQESQIGGNQHDLLESRQDKIRDIDELRQTQSLEVGEHNTNLENLNSNKEIKDNEENNTFKNKISSLIDNVEIINEILKLKDNIIQDENFQYSLYDKQNSRKLFADIFKNKYLDFYLENSPFLEQLGDKQLEFKNNIQDIVFNEIMEEYEKSLKTNENKDNELGVSKGENGEQDNTNELLGETHLGKEQESENIILEQENINENLNLDFKTFSEYQFLDILDGAEYKGEIDFNLNKSQRIEANLEALKLTQEIFSQNRLIATPTEQEVLAKFSGFGGLRELFFDERYEKERAEFENILGKKLYKEISYSSFNAYYTPKNIINSMFRGLEKVGVPSNEKVKALEPSCGIGHFITLAPPNYEFEAVEKDILTATIAKFLHPKTKIHNKGFEEIDFDREFDVVIGNPPYENIRIDDKENKELIHNYFVLKSQNLLKEQGVSSFVITSGFLDSTHNTHRLKLTENNLLLNAFRLPNSAFGATHTNVLSDIVFLQKVADFKSFNARLENQIRQKYDDNSYSINLTHDLYNMRMTLEKLEEKTFAMESLSTSNIDEKDINFNKYFELYYDNIIGMTNAGTNQFGENTLLVRDDGSLENLSEHIQEKQEIYQNFYNTTPAKDSDLKSLHNMKLDNDKINYIQELRIGNIFEYNNNFYIKEKGFSYSEVYFIDKISRDKKYILNEKDIILNPNKDGSEKETKDIQYKTYPNDKEKEILKLIIEFRDLLKKNIKNEKELPNDDLSNEAIMADKKQLRDLRDKIISLSNAKSFNQTRQQRKTDENKMVVMHTLKDMIELEKLESYRIRSCENEIKKIINGKNIVEYEVSDILNKRVLYPIEKKEATNPTEALQKTINDVGIVDLEILQSYLPKMPLIDICKELSENELIFPNLNTKNSYDLKSVFLSGNIKNKLEKINDMIETNAKFDLPFSLELNQYAEILKNNFPKDIGFEDIEITFGANFIDIDIYENFIKETFFENPSLADVKFEKNKSFYILENFNITQEREDGTILTRTADTKNNGDLNELAKSLEVNNEKQKRAITIKAMLEKTINNEKLEVAHSESIGDGKYRRIVETIPTKKALDNSENIKDMFSNYIFNNKEYRDRIEKKYNEIINVFSNTKLEYKNYLEMPTLNKDIKFRQHQDNAVFKGISNQAMLFDHQVGAGKTLVAIGLVMEQIRMGMIKKALILVPNHLPSQWANEFLRAYPTANLLVGDKINSKKERKEFLYRTRNGDFDAIIMKHSTFENMNVMQTFEKSLIEKELLALQNSLNERNNKDKDDNNISDSSMNRYLLSRKKSLEEKLTKKAKGKTYDDEIAFEDLGIDCLIVDEAHLFKNLFIETKQQVKGLPQTDSQKAMKMYCATQYMHQNNFKLYFLTGTPVTNSIAEFYTMLRYMQPKTLSELGLEHFDDWQKAFTSIVTSEELDSSGVNYTLVSRLSKFINAPELMAIYKQNADIITNEDIEKITGRIVPKFETMNVVTPRSELQGNYIGIEDENGKYTPGSIIDRMDKYHEDPRRNNPLVCTSDARKAGLDFRLINPEVDDYEDSKINKMIEKILFHYNDERYEKNTQIVFCDLGVSKNHSQKVNMNETLKLKSETIEETASRLGLEFYIEKEKVIDDSGEEREIEADSYWIEYKKDKNGNFILDKNNEKIIHKKYGYADLVEEQSNFDVYSDVLKKLVKNGIKQEEIAFIGDAKTDIQKQALFDKVNAGDIRIIIGSTNKMGAGTNIQQRVVALHELDCPWRPDEMQQRLGRAVRQGNMFFERDKENFKLAHYRYATEQTYDSRMFQINEQKLLPLIQIKKADVLEKQRVFDSIDSELVNISDMKAVSTGNPFILEKHILEKIFKEEVQGLEYYKRSLIASEKTLDNLKNQNAFLIKELEALRECFNNKGFSQDNYEIEIFGIKTSKKLKNKSDENAFKEAREKIAKELMKMENQPDTYVENGKIEVLKANNISLIFTLSFGGLDKSNVYFNGKIITQNGNSLSAENLIFKSNRGVLQRSIVLDGLLERLKNTFEKIPSMLQKYDEKIKENNCKINEKENFLKNNNVENYERKILLDTLKQDVRNMKEIINIRNAKRKDGIKIDMDSPEIKDLLPQYKKLLNEKGKFIGAEEAKKIKSLNNVIKNENELLKNKESKKEDKISRVVKKAVKIKEMKSENKAMDTNRDGNQKQNITKEIEKEILSIDENIQKVQQIQIDFKEFQDKQSLEEKISILKENQINIKNTPRSKYL
ncbi:hypothetical protein T36_2207 (plasmid) [Helicobacter cinaedi]|uniref:SNF2-related protein n=1 Tax=Helicobacter cinaedi TaxID=213 RepID=UPI001EEDEAD3|nr:SNF2-related protein [Helicobacter cinaedi]BDB65728.1 hypothetical protein T36_2207 [Helicobacter cinaedi]